MKLAKDDYARRKRREPRGPARHGRGFAIVVLMVAATALLVLSRVDHAIIRGARMQVSDTFAPVLELVAQPVAYVRQLRSQLQSYSDLLHELERMKQENQQLRQWQWRAEQLEGEIGAYRSLLSAVGDKGFRFVTARVVSESRGPFSRTILATGGSADGIRNGFAVVDSEGLVGRVIDTGQSSARILLVTDVNSRIPVMVGRAGAHAILKGRNGGLPFLDYIKDGAAIAPGDAVLTSGEDGVLPKGLRIGVMATAGEGAEVRPASRLDALDFVSIIFYEGPSLDLVGDSRKESRSQVAERRVAGAKSGERE
ncbi:MAG: rod shape-determining protein MreC [Hyphomicrobiaceae bacterium]